MSKLYLKGYNIKDYLIFIPYRVYFGDLIYE